MCVVDGVSSESSESVVRDSLDGLQHLSLGAVFVKVPQMVDEVVVSDGAELQ